MGVYMENNTSWKKCIKFGIINILLAFLCMISCAYILSALLIFLGIAGVIYSAKLSIKEFLVEHYLSSFVCAMGMFINIFSIFLYILGVAGRMFFYN